MGLQLSKAVHMKLIPRNATMQMKSGGKSLMLLQRNFSFASNSTTKVKNVVINVPSVQDS